MKHKILISLFAVILMLSFGSIERVLADESELCYLLGSADSVFVGEISQTDATKFVFNVREDLVGVKKDETYSIEKGIGYCDDLQSGKSYLIFAQSNTSVYRNNIKIPVKECLKAKELKDSTEDLQILRNLVSQSNGVTIAGNINQQTTNGLFFKPEKNLNNIKIRVSKADNQEVVAETTTDIKGNYQFKNITVGNYEIKPILPDWLEPHYSNSQKILIKKNVGCLDKSFFIQNKSELSGRIIDEKDNPIKEFTIELIQLNERLQPIYYKKVKRKTLKKTITQNDFTNEKGEFSFYNLPIGKYVLAINFKYAPNPNEPFSKTFYPNSSSIPQAKIFKIGKAEKITDVVFKLPPKMKGIEIKGKITGVKLPLPENIEVSIKDLETNQSFEGNIDSQGNFTVIGFKGRKYRIKANSVWNTDTDYSSVDNYSAQTPIFILGNTSLFYTLNLRKSL